ncbi:MAG TPA: hypothetical protein PKD86_15360, partial [Gemmatales bacterium]|nr:hypothetical protein [Gemmatales bacterium]
VFGAWLTFLMMPPLAAMAILALNKKEVKYEFEVSRLRAAGVEDPYAELEALEAERQGGDDDEDDDEDEDD